MQLVLQWGLEYSNHLNTGLVWYSMVDLCPVVKWSCIQIFKAVNSTEKILLMVQNVQYSNGPPIHMTTI